MEKMLNEKGLKIGMNTILNSYKTEKLTIEQVIEKAVVLGMLYEKDKLNESINKIFENNGK